MLDRSLPQLGGSEWALLDRSTDQVMPPSKSMLPKVWAIQGVGCSLSQSIQLIPNPIGSPADGLQWFCLSHQV